MASAGAADADAVDAGAALETDAALETGAAAEVEVGSAEAAEEAVEADAEDAEALLDDPCEHPKRTKAIASVQAPASSLVTVHIPSSVLQG